MSKPKIDISGENFGTMLNCAVRYAIGRESYMPGFVISYITPLLPYLSKRTLYVFDQDVTDQRYTGGYGDPSIDEPSWMRFLDAVHAEQDRRGYERYMDFREEQHDI